MSRLTVISLHLTHAPCTAALLSFTACLLFFAVKDMMNSKTDLTKGKLWKMVDAAREVSDILKGKDKEEEKRR